MDVPTLAQMTAEGKKPEILFWVGCAGSFDDRAKKISKSFVNDAPAESLVAIVRAYRGLTSKFAAVSAFSDNVSPSMAKEDESPPDKE